MAKRKIIKIDERKCNGCALCIPNCPEGAIRIIDDKARLISDLFCDGLGACLGHCPQGAITIEEREAEEYDERKVMFNIAKAGKNVIKAHLDHLKEHNQKEYFEDAIDFLKEHNIEIPLEKAEKTRSGGCPGARIMDFRQSKAATKPENFVKTQSELRQWPVQLMLIPAFAPFLENADLLIAADCVPFSYADFHQDLLRGKVLLVGCPKFDDVGRYQEKITQILKNNNIRSLTYAHMEVPCCSGLVSAIQLSIAASGKNVPFKEAIISVQGERLQ